MQVLLPGKLTSKTSRWNCLNSSKSFCKSQFGQKEFSSLHMQFGLDWRNSSQFYKEFVKFFLNYIWSKKMNKLISSLLTFFCLIKAPLQTFFIHVEFYFYQENTNGVVKITRYDECSNHEDHKNKNFNDGLFYPTQWNLHFSYAFFIFATI